MKVLGTGYNGEARFHTVVPRRRMRLIGPAKQVKLAKCIHTGVPRLELWNTVTPADRVSKVTRVC